MLPMRLWHSFLTVARTFVGGLTQFQAKVTERRREREKKPGGGKKKKKEEGGWSRRHDALARNVVYRALPADGVAPAVLRLLPRDLGHTRLLPAIPLSLFLSGSKKHFFELFMVISFELVEFEVILEYLIISSQIILGQIIIRITHDFQYLYLLIIFIILAFQNIKNCDSNFDWPIHHNTYNIPVYFKILYHPL